MYDRIPQVLFREHPSLEHMLMLIRIAHGDQLYNGAPYFHHPIRVMLRMNWWDLTSEEVYAALGHDLLEDTAVTREDLQFYGYSDKTIGLIKLLTREHDGEQTYKDYIQGLIAIGDIELLRIKLCDMYENSNNVRFLPMEKRKILVRYGKSIKEVQDFLAKTPRGQAMLENTISGELDKETLEAWIGQEPTFL